MLIGEYEHSLDSKGRINFPSKLREDLGESFIITRGLDVCLFVYSIDQWKILEEKMKNLPTAKARSIQRYLFAPAVEVVPDKQGRVNIPQNLREHACLKDNVTVIGISTRAEVWDSERWKAENAKLNSEDIASIMDELGF